MFRNYYLGGLVLAVLLVPFPVGRAEKSDAVLSAARASIEARQYPRATGMLSALTKGHPTNAKAFILRGRALTGVGDFEGALKDFNSARRLTPQDPEALAEEGF